MADLLPVDLRSDTVTRPTPEMRRAMGECEVGDDRRGSDPTVERLQTIAAEALGKDAAVFVPSGFF
ncbi:MAG: beta-eliminating lyase-related protein, partial [Planctomycetota bacterium]